MNNKASIATDSRYLVDPELLDLLDRFPTREISAETLSSVRERPREIGWGDLSEVDRAVVVDESFASPEVPLHVYRPRNVADGMGCFLYLHGGGFVNGSTGACDGHLRKLVSAVGCIAVSADYRLAPETRFPDNIEDCYAALKWVFENARRLNLNPDRIGVMGESAGGGLAASLALLARDRGEYDLAFQHLTYPMLDDRTGLAKPPRRFAGEYVWTAANNQFGWSSLLVCPPGDEEVSPYAAAARAKHLGGLPPTYLSTATLDLFFEENLEYGRRLVRAGVPLELHVYPGGFHGFDLHPTAEVALAARRASIGALKRFVALQ